MHVATESPLLLTQLIHSSVVSPTGDRIGRVEDVIARLSDRGYPRVSGWKVRIGGRDLFVPEDMVVRVEPGRIQLETQRLHVGRFERRPGEVLLHEHGEEIIDAVEADPELTADVFEELEPEHQVEFLESRSDSEAAELLAHMAPDDAADLLNELDQERRRPVLELMPAQEGQKLRNLLQHHPSTAGGLMSPDFIAVERGTLLRDVLERVRSGSNVPSPLLGTVFVTEPDGRLIGTVSTADVLRGDPDEVVEELSQLVSGGVPLDADLQDIALRMTDFNLFAVGVMDDEDRLIGAISVDALVGNVLPEEWRRRAEASAS